MCSSLLGYYYLIVICINKNFIHTYLVFTLLFRKCGVYNRFVIIYMHFVIIIKLNQTNSLAHRYGVRLMDDFKQVIAQAR